MASAEKGGPRTVFVGGFSESTDATLLHTVFSTFGDVVDVQLPPDPSQRKPHRGFAFLTYTDAESALDAIDNMHLNELPDPSNKGKTLKVNTAKAPKGQSLAGSNKASTLSLSSFV